ncbi:SAV_2336 N-terminal domain-related protein [Streptomyces sp. NL15-2K]|uniref:SAV_2336 N-terminal domain-related protein n=3 Tax=Streptomyces sp. NL15-2K TaxID=376149 RepID=UPI0026EE0E25|nr:SAV_2336 N-terminal domain-related protein [Kutzneria buriramensis]WKX08828.1 SAV_2336 N-terminal domain-related protein [Kutzneria buriramensis]
MPSERPGSRPGTPLVRLTDVLTEAAGGVRPTPLELAELLWLARHMEPPADAPAAPAPQSPTEDVRPPEPTGQTRPPLPPKQQDSATSPPLESPRAPLHLPATARLPGTSNELHTPLLAPAPPMLRHPLALQRSLRPLKRRTDAPDRPQLDERATADRIARLGAAPEWWLPVLRPAQERWLRLNLVYDAGPTMPVWRPLVRELHTALAQSGIFRTVTLHRAEPDGTVRHHGAHTPADGRTVTLLVSDCMGPQWRQGPAGTLWYATLRRWAHRMPLAVVQPLPEHLWRDTALPTTPGLLSAPHPAAPNTALAFTPYERDGDDGDDGPGDPGGFLPLPVLEPGPRWLANWASLIAVASGQEFPGAAARLSRPLPTDSDDRTDVTGLSAEELVLRFRAAASPEAFRLAGHLALGRPDLPVMRLVQAALEPHPRPQHLAEVILSGMLTGVAGPPGSYAFRPGVRELLLRGLPRTARSRTTDLLSRMGALIDERAGAAAGEIRATTPLAASRVTVTKSEPIATVTPRTRDRLVGVEPGRRPALGARYRILERLGPSGSLWRAEDTERRRSVVVRLHSMPSEPERLQAFLRATEALAALDHPNVVAVHDHGVEDGQRYVVMEYLDGISLNSLVSPGGYRLPAPLLVSLGRQLADALTAVHEGGVAHGALDMTKVLILPDGTAKLTLFDLGQASGGEAYWRDLRALGKLLFHLSSGSPAQVGMRISADRFAALPDALRPTYAMILGRLLSDDLMEQQEGVGLLQQPGLVEQARTAHAPLRYSLLGRPSVSRGPAHPLATGSPQERAMLAMLLLHHGRRVTHTRLTEGIWGRKTPTRAAALLGTYASRLRNALGPGVLATLSDGYALHTSADHVDIITCQQLVERTEKERAAGNIASARATVDDALNLWDGDPLTDVPGPAAAAARTRFLQLHLSLCATGAELDLELGEFERAATDLAELLRAYPAREDFRRLYLIALRRQGRIEEALGAYEEYELSGGRNPELLAQGRELREEFGDAPEDPAGEPAHEEHPDAPTDIDTAYGFVAAPDELPEGFFPPEDETPLLRSLREELPEGTPLPRDEVPDGLFAVEDALLAERVEDAYDEPAEEDDDAEERDERDFVRFGFADRPQPAAAAQELRRLVEELVDASGLTPHQFELLDDAEGSTLRLGQYVDGGDLFTATVEGLHEQLAQVGGLPRLRVEFWRAEFRYDGGEEQGDRPDTGSVTAALDASGARAIIALSDFWHSVEVLDGAFGDPDLFRQLDDGTGWYLLVQVHS